MLVGHLVNPKRKSQTIRSYILVIKAVLLDGDIEIDKDTNLLTLLTKACRLRNDRVVARLPIHKDMLHMILNRTDSYFRQLNQLYLRILYTTLFMTVYYGLFRVGELTTGSHPVMVGNVHIVENKNKFLLLLRTSKTHWKMKSHRE